MSVSAKWSALCPIFAAACGSPAHPPPLILDNTCAGCPEGGLPPSGTHDAGPALLDTDTWNGTRVTFGLGIGKMKPPNFTWPADLIALTKPATVHFPFNKFDYIQNYDPTVANKFTNVPAGHSFAMVTDVDGANGILNSVFDVTADGSDWQLPVTSIESLDAIYASLGYVIDPSYAQVIISVVDYLHNYAPVPNAVISTKGLSTQDLVYDTASGFGTSSTGTGPNGMAIMVNAGAVGLEYPGKWFPIYVTINGGLQPGQLDFPVVKNAVTRVFYSVGGFSGP
jgi:hypothetical protein